MSKEKRRVPKLRFPGFTEDWEQRKFKDLFIERREKTIRENEETLLSCAITGIYLNSELFSHFRGSSTIGYLKIKKYDLILSAQNLHLGNANINLSFDKGMISPAYKVFELKSIDPYFINAWVKKDSTKNFFLKATTEGASQCRKNIEWDVLLNQEIPVPNKLEQRTIGRFINNIDMIITLHQRKLEHLNLKKKALFQKLFPKNGERYPELRFPGFTDAWEQRKLGDYLIPYTEITTQNNQYPVLTSSRKGLFFQTDYYDGNQIASKDNTGYNIVPYGYFTYRHMSDDEIFHFNINYIVDKGIVSTLYPVFTTKNLNSNFLQLQLNYGNEFRKYAVLLKQGGSRTYMYFNKLKNLNLTISTSIGEQEIIAKFFILFEKLITLHQRKLEHLQLQKKALLQQMFV